jgi:hypothetical protein
MSIVLADERIFNDIFADTIDCKNLRVSKSLKVGNINYPTTEIPGSLWYSNSDGNGVFQGARLLACFLPPAVVFTGTGDHIQYRTVQFQAGTKVTLDVTTPYTTAFGVPSIGRVTLQPGRYHVKAVLQEYSLGGLATTEFGLTLYNADTGVALTADVPLTGSPRRLLHDETVVSVAIATRIEFRVTDNSEVGPGAYGNAFIEVEELP